MAVALVVMALVQIGLIIVALRVARQAGQAAEMFRQELRPLIDRVNTLSDKISVVVDDAGRVTSLALTQVQRVDHALAVTAERVDSTLSIVQGLISGPVRRSSALVAAFKAAMTVVRTVQDRRRVRRDVEEDALFVG
jgi:hypothetical protein